jgi:VWFA-related protein
MRLSIFSVLWLSVLLVPGVLTGQEAGSESDDVFIETVDVNVVNVEVFVTDRNGQPVTGLQADDFELFEDKRPVAISNFYAVEDGRLGGENLPEKEDNDLAGPGEDSQSVRAALPGSQRLSLIVFVDNFNIRPFNRNRVLRQLRVFLQERMDHADQVMLVSYDRSINIRHPFTSDPTVIGRAMFELEEMTGHALSQDSERREIIRAIDEAQTATEVEWRVRQYAESLYNDLSFTLSSLREFVDTLAGLEGRKAILYVSDGLQMIAAEDLFQALMQKFITSASVSQMFDFNAQRKFRELANLASTNRVAFYTIDAAGLRTPTLASAEFRGTMDPAFTTVMDATYRSNLQAPLRLMAEETGGTAIYNTNSIDEALERMNSDFGTYYSLGYMPSHSDQGRYHRIEVRVKNGERGLKIRHRTGYRSKSMYDQMADGVHSTLLYGFERNPLEVALRVGKGRQQDKGLFLVPIAVDIPIANLELVPREEVYLGRLRLFFEVADDEQNVSEVQELPLPVQIPSAEIDTARQHPYVYMAELQMRSGSQRIAIGVRDEIGAVDSFIVRTVMIGSS